MFLKLFYRLLAIFILIFFSPLLFLLFILVKLESPGSFFFKQKRIGKDGRIFTLYKIRTMVPQAEKMKKKYRFLNEADGPVFKIRNDPRYTKLGKILSHTGLDEFPQLINIIKGEMSFVGPRPLPIDEAQKIPQKYKERFSVLPGITSLWVAKGAEHSSFSRWMEMDLEYIRNKSLWYDLKILSKSVLMIIRLLISYLNLKKIFQLN